jgi:hypothetical protein
LVWSVRIIASGKKERNKERKRQEKFSHSVSHGQKVISECTHEQCVSRT